MPKWFRIGQGPALRFDKRRDLKEWLMTQESLPARAAGHLAAQAWRGNGGEVSQVTRADFERESAFHKN